MNKKLTSIFHDLDSLLPFSLLLTKLIEIKFHGISFSFSRNVFVQNGRIQTSVQDFRLTQSNSRERGPT